MDFLHWVFLAVGILVFLSIIPHLFRYWIILEMEKALAALPDFDPSQQFLDTYTGIALDEEQSRICLLKKVWGPVDVRCFEHRDVLASEVLVNGETVLESSRSSPEGQARLAELAFGKLSMSVREQLSADLSRPTLRVDLLVTVNDAENPFHYLHFLHTQEKKVGHSYPNALEEAEKWQQRLTHLIDLADDEEYSARFSAIDLRKPLSATAAITDELLKLSQLREQGILTEAEFVTLKKRLLS